MNYTKPTIDPSVLGEFENAKDAFQATYLSLGRHDNNGSLLPAQLNAYMPMLSIAICTAKEFMNESEYTRLTQRRGFRSTLDSAIQVVRGAANSDDVRGALLPSGDDLEQCYRVLDAVCKLSASPKSDGSAAATAVQRHN